MTFRSIPSTVLAAAIVIAAAPGTVAGFQERPVRSLLETRHQNVIIQEWDTSCGAAALATILRFQFGDQVTERSVAAGMVRQASADRVRGRGGFSLLDMKRYAESRGLAADGYADMTTGQLLRAAPAIVPVASHAGDHFVVFRGVVHGQAILADPAFGNRSIPYSEFESRWKDRLAFVVKAKGAAANRLFATHRDLLRVDDDSERQAMDEAMPKALSDAQLSLAFAVGFAPPPAPTPIALETPPAAGVTPRPSGRAPSTNATTSSPTTSSGTLTVSSSPSAPISVTTSPSTPLSPVASAAGNVIAPITSGVGVALPPISITISAPLPPPPLGR